jgi:hypothetical protein
MITLTNLVYNKGINPSVWPRIFKHYFNDADQAHVGTQATVQSEVR